MNAPGGGSRLGLRIIPSDPSLKANANQSSDRSEQNMPQPRLGPRAAGRSTLGGPMGGGRATHNGGFHSSPAGPKSAAVLIKPLLKNDQLGRARPGPNPTERFSKSDRAYVQVPTASTSRAAQPMYSDDAFNHNPKKTTTCAVNQPPNKPATRTGAHSGHSGPPKVQPTPTRKGKEREVLTVDDDDTAHDSIEDSDTDPLRIVTMPTASKDNKLKFVPARKPKEGQTPRRVRALTDSARAHTGEFDSPPHARPPTLIQPKQSMISRMKPRMTAPLQQKGGQNLVDSGQTPIPSAASVVRPEPKRGSKSNAVESLALPIKPYAFARDLVFPLNHVAQPHSITFTPNPKVDRGLVSIRRLTDQRWQTLAKFARDDFDSVVIHADQPVLGFTLTKRRAKTTKGGSPLEPLFDSVPVVFDQWRDSVNAEQRQMTIVFNEDHPDFEPDAYTQLVKRLREWERDAPSEFRTHEERSAQTTGVVLSEYDSRLAEAQENLVSGSTSTSRAQRREQVSSSPEPPIATKPFSLSREPSPHRTRTIVKDEKERQERNKPAKSKKPKEPIDTTPSNKLRLVWPYKDDQGEPVPHGMQLVHADFKRLENKDEFLNDTLIDFELRRILLNHNDQLKARLGSEVKFDSDVHVFNSFFFKMLLQNKGKEKNAPSTYQSVRKWTSKFDLFEKKFVVIPVNEHLHWYLAIIVNPGAVLREPKPKPEPVVMETRRGRSSIEGKNSTKPVTSRHFATLNPEIFSTERPSSTTPQPESQPLSPLHPAREDDSDDKPMEVDLEVEVVQDSQKPPSPVQDVPGQMEVDSAVQSPPTGVVQASLDPDPVDVDTEVEVVAAAQVEQAPPPSQPRVAVSFTPSQRPPGESDQMVEVGDELDRIDLDQADNPSRGKSPDQDGFDPNTCYIYTFDSLQGPHTKVVNRLRLYLDEEAKDKKQVDNPSGVDAVGVEVYVPQQEGYSNCGLYILHYVERFLRDDGAIRNFIHTAEGHAKAGARDKSSKYASAAVAKQWDAEAAEGKRAAMRDELEALSAEWEAWNKPRQEAEEQANREKEERRKKQKLEQQKSDIVADPDSIASARASPAIPTQESSIEVTSKPIKARSTPPDDDLASRAPARAKALHVAADTAAFYAQQPVAGRSGQSATAGVSKGGKTLRKPKKSLEYKEQQSTRKARQDLGQIVLSDSDDGSEDDLPVLMPPRLAGRPSSPPASRAPSPKAAPVDRPVPEDKSEGGTSVQALAPDSDPSSTDTSSGSDTGAGDEEHAQIESAPVPALVLADLPNPPELPEGLADYARQHPTQGRPATPPEAGHSSLVEGADDADGPASPPRAKRGKRRVSISASPENILKLKLTTSLVDQPSPVPASPTEPTHTRFGHPASGLGLLAPVSGGGLILADNSDSSEVGSSSDSDPNGAAEALVMLSPDRKEGGLGKREREVTPGPSGRARGRGRAEVEVGGKEEGRKAKRAKGVAAAAAAVNLKPGESPERRASLRTKQVLTLD